MHVEDPRDLELVVHNLDKDVQELEDYDNQDLKEEDIHYLEKGHNDA